MPTQNIACNTIIPKLTGSCVDTTQTRYCNKTLVYNDIDRRVSPPEPMFLSPTALTEQSTTTVRDGHFHMPSTYSRIYGCTITEHNRIASSNIPTATLPSFEADWALELRRRIKDDKVNLGPAIAEADKTAKLFHGLGKGIKDAWGLYRGRLPKSQRRKIRPCDIPASYLATTYGLEPLINDVYDSVVALNNEWFKPKYQRYKSKAERTSKGSWGSSSTKGGSTLQKVSQRSVIYLEHLPNASQFTAGNVAEVAWEVVPFSFVVDWGIGVGDWLSSLDALTGYNIVAGTLTTKKETSNTLDHWYGQSLVDPGIYQKTTHERTVISSVPIPPRPRIGFGPSYRRLTNAVALLWAVNEKCKP